jgi:hypothetical protein
MKCWICGAEPELVEVTSLEDAHPTYIPGRWPSAGVGHEHAIKPPTPRELAAAGDRAMGRLLAIFAE